MAVAIVGIERKKENSSADARDIPAICPAAIVDIDREVPGKTAERIWQAPIQMDWPSDMSSMCQVWMRLYGAPGPAFSDVAFIASTNPHYDPADDQAHADDVEALEMLADNFRQQKSGERGDEESDDHEAERMREDGAVAALACGNVERNFAMRSRK